MSTKDLMAKARRAYEEGWNEGKVAVYDELFADNFVSHTNTQPEARTREEYKQGVVHFRADWADAHLVIDDMFAVGDQVAARGTFSAVHQRGEVRGVPAMGKHATWAWITIFRFAGGKIVELWNNFDNLGLLQQIGVIALPAESKK